MATLSSTSVSPVEDVGLLRTRVSRFGLICSLALLIMGALRHALAWMGQPSPLVFEVAHLLIAAAILAGSWLLTRGARAWTLRGLHIVHTLSLLGACTMLAVRALHQPSDSPADLVLLLVLTHAMLLRSVYIPSTSLRAVASGLLLTPLYLLVVVHSASNADGISRAAFMTLWWIAAVLLSWFASHIVYGLRREVHSAMRLGQYTLDERIGEGAMGVVYRARHALLKRPTAVKVLRPERASEIDVARFEREVQLTSQLTHPNTVKVYDYGRTEDGLLYYAMELVDGASLQDVVTVGGPQPIGRVIRILLHVASALAEAHDIGLIHRDIKPANILLCFQGGEPDVAKVVDFGLARKLARESGPALTMSNALLGTPLYLAPEAIKAPDTLDGRGDIYALGAVGYFLVTGSDVFDAASVIAVCADHLYQRPESPSKRLGATIPAEVEDLIMTCLRKDPNDRWPDAHALEAALGALADDYRWTRADAESWWAEHGPRLEQLTGKRRIDAPSQPLRPRRRQLRAEGATLLRGWGFGN